MIQMCSRKSNLLINHCDKYLGSWITKHTAPHSFVSATLQSNQNFT
uniref:Uncharacterized protein n=1 Tax=Anguilla anguilla TaxID=7936 RepID=A0A0E9Q4C5_ANGAN